MYVYEVAVTAKIPIFGEFIIAPIEEIGYFIFSNNNDVLPNEALLNSIVVFDDVACDKQDVIIEYFAIG